MIHTYLVYQDHWRTLMSKYGFGTCQWCNDQFEYTANHQVLRGKKFCSKVCKSENQKARLASERLEVTCKICKTKELISSSKVKSYRTCSMDCLSKWQSKKLTGLAKPPSWYEKQKKAKSRANVRKEGEYPCENCKKVFKSNTSLRSHRHACQKGVSSKVFECSLCDKQFTTNAGLGNHKKWHTRTQKEIDTIGENIRQGQANSEWVMPKVSNAESTFFNELSEILGLEIQRGYKISNYYHEYDGYIKELNILIEFDGDYWHGNPELYDLTERMKTQRIKDYRHNVIARSKDYNLVRVYQSNSHTFLQEIRDNGTIPKNQINQEKYQEDPGLRSSNQKES